MPPDGALAAVLAIIFLATLTCSTLGFGEALVAVPLLSLVIPVEVAVPLIGLVSILVAVLIVAQDWRHIHLRSAFWLVLSTCFGIPLGLLLLTQVPERVIKAILALVIILFSLYCLLSRKLPELPDDRFAWLFGFVAGILGGAYGINGPPLVIYAALRRWTAEYFRATLQGFFLPSCVLTMGGYWLAGLWVPAVTYYFLLSLPPIVVAIVLGKWLNRRLKGRSFFRVVHVGLVAVGLLLLLQSLR